MKAISIWENKNEIKNTNNNPPNDIDILIIGAGISGLSCAYFLKDINKTIIIIDKDKIECDSYVFTQSKKI